MGKSCTKSGREGQWGGGERDGREGGNGGVDGNVVRWVAKKLGGELDRN